MIMAKSFSDDSLDLSNLPSCGNEQFVALESFAVGWPRRDLTFGFVNTCPTVNVTDTRNVTVAAFAQWSSVTTLRFTEVAAAGADIKIGWFNGDHGDGLAFLRFDGKGGEFGHGFGPSSPIRAGEVHMDRAENWTVGALTTGNADLMTVVLHEIGHALGLRDHLPDVSAVMFRRFPLDSVKRALTGSDITAIRALYP
jgi:hypothetical protein